MAEKEFCITGRVIDQTGRRRGGLRVEAWDRGLIWNDFIGRINTDEHRQPDLFFRGRGVGKFIRLENSR